MDWYEETIEPEIRPIVKLLRNNGFNTTCSCGREMYVECEIITDGTLQKLDNLLFNNGFTDYKITISVDRVAGNIYSAMRVDL